MPNFKRLICGRPNPPLNVGGIPFEPHGDGQTISCAPMDEDELQRIARIPGYEIVPADEDEGEDSAPDENSPEELVADTVELDMVSDLLDESSQAQDEPEATVDEPTAEDDKPADYLASLGLRPSAEGVLRDRGYTTREALQALSLKELVDMPKIGESAAKKIIEAGKA